MKTELGFTEVLLRIQTSEEMSVLLHALGQYDAQSGVTAANKTAQAMLEGLNRIREKTRELNQVLG